MLTSVSWLWSGVLKSMLRAMPPNGQAQVQWANEITLARSKVDATAEQGNTDPPIVTWSTGLCGAYVIVFTWFL